MQLTIRIHNIKNNEIIDRDMTDAEMTQWELGKIQEAERQQQEISKAAEKTALLAKLGITDNEAKLLLS